MNEEVQLTMSGSNSDMNGSRAVAPSSLHDKLQRSKRLRQQLGSDNRSVQSGNSLASPCASHEADERHMLDPISPRSLSLEKRESLVERRRRALQKSRTAEESENTSRTSLDSSSSKSGGGRSHDITQDAGMDPIIVTKSKVIKTSSLFSNNSQTTQAERKLNGLSTTSSQKPEEKVSVPTWKTMRSQIVNTTPPPPPQPPTISRVGTIAASMNKPFPQKAASVSHGSNPAPSEPEEATMAVASASSQDENSDINNTFSQEESPSVGDLKSVSVASLRASFSRSQAAQLVAARTKIPTKTPQNTPDTTPIYNKTTAVPEINRSDSSSKIQPFSPPPPTQASPVVNLSKQQPIGTPNTLQSGENSVSKINSSPFKSPNSVPSGENSISKISSSPFKSPFSKVAPKPPASAEKSTTNKSLFKVKTSNLSATKQPTSLDSTQVDASPAPTVQQVDATPSPTKASAFDAARHRFADQRSPPLPRKILPKVVKASPSSSSCESPAPSTSPKNAAAPPSWQRRSSPSPGNTSTIAPGNGSTNVPSGNTPTTVPGNTSTSLPGNTSTFRPNTPPVSKVLPFKANQSPSPTMPTPVPGNGSFVRPSTPPVSKVLPLKATQSPSPTMQIKPSLSWQQRGLPPPPLTSPEESPAAPKQVKTWQKKIPNDEPTKPAVPAWVRPTASVDQDRSLPASMSAGSEQTAASKQSAELEPPKSPSRAVWQARSNSARAMLPAPPSFKSVSPFQDRTTVKVSDSPVATLKTIISQPTPPQQAVVVAKSRFERTPPWVKNEPSVSVPEPLPPVTTRFVSRRRELNLEEPSIQNNNIDVPDPTLQVGSVTSSVPSPTDSSVRDRDNDNSPDAKVVETYEIPTNEPETSHSAEIVTTPSNKSLVQMAADSIFASDYVEALRFESKLNQVYSLDDESQLSSLPGKVIPVDLPDDLRRALDADPPLELPEDVEESANAEPEPPHDRFADIDSANPDPPLELPGDHSADDSSDEGLPAKSPLKVKTFFTPIASSPRSDPSQKRGRKIYRSPSPSPRGLIPRPSITGSPSAKARRKEVSAEILKKMQALNLAKSPTETGPSIIFGDPLTFGAAGGEIPQQAPRIADRAKAIEDWNGGRGKPPSPSVSRSPQRAIGSLASPGSERALNFARSLRMHDNSPRNEEDNGTPNGGHFQSFSPAQFRRTDAGFEGFSSASPAHEQNGDPGVGTNPWDEGAGVTNVEPQLNPSITTAAKVRHFWSRGADELETIEPVTWIDDFPDPEPTFLPEVDDVEFSKSVEEAPTDANDKDAGAGWPVGTPSRTSMAPSEPPDQPSSKGSDQFFPPDDPFDVSFAYSFLSSPPRSVRGEVFDPFFNEEDFDGFGGPREFFPPALEQEIHSTKAADGSFSDFSASPFFPENAATPKSRGGDLKDYGPTTKDKERTRAPVNKAHQLMLPTMQDVDEIPTNNGVLSNGAPKDGWNNSETTERALPGQSPRPLRPPPFRPGIPRPSTPNRRKPILMRKQQQLAQAYDDNYAMSLTPERIVPGHTGDSEAQRKTTEFAASDWDDDFNFEI